MPLATDLPSLALMGQTGNQVRTVAIVLPAGLDHAWFVPIPTTHVSISPACSTWNLRSASCLGLDPSPASPNDALHDSATLGHRDTLPSFRAAALAEALRRFFLFHGDRIT